MKITVQNPVIYSDFPDPDIIRVGNAFYMISTTMHFMPGGDILRSYNLRDWETVCHLYDILDDYPDARMENGKNIYGSGMWAASLKYHNGKFYVLHIANDTKCSYLYEAEKIEGPWKQKKIEGFYHDPALFFDDDGRAYVAYGNRQIHLTELNDDLSAPKKGGLDRVIVRDADKTPLGWEGSHLYKINGKYYLFLIHWEKDKPRSEGCFVADSLNGEWTGGETLCDDMGFFNAGVAQGGIFDTPEGDWYAMLFQDHGAQGRMPCLVPVKWEGERPVFGVDGKVPQTLQVTDFNPGYKYKPLFGADDFNYSDSNKDSDTGTKSNHSAFKDFWEWNHIPDEKNWRIENSHLILKTDTLSANLVSAKNILTQRLFGEKCAVSVKIDASKINEGDTAGLAAFAGCYGFAGITKKDGKFFVVHGKKSYPDDKVKGDRNDTSSAKITQETEIFTSECELKIEFDFENLKDEANFYYKLIKSTDFSGNEAEWKKIGETQKFWFLLDHFCGLRAGFFIFSQKQAGGEAGFADFNQTQI